MNINELNSTLNNCIENISDNMHKAWGHSDNAITEADLYDFAKIIKIAMHDFRENIIEFLKENN